MDKILKQAFQDANKDLENNKLAHYKQIIKNLLEKKISLEKEGDEIGEKIRIIKNDIDDFKDGRLDKVEERHRINKEADKVAPIKITIINNNQKTIFPTQPWKWDYNVIWDINPNFYPNINNYNYCGTTYANFTTGTYSLTGGGIINL